MKRDKRQPQSPNRGRDGQGARRPHHLLPVARPSPFTLLALGVLVIAAVLRFHGLGAASLWYDEALTLDIAAGPLGELPGDVRAREQIPPLYHVLMHVWVDQFGESEFAARFPSAIFGIAAVAAAIALGRALFGPREGLAAGALLALAGFQVYYAQECRPYSLLVLMSLLSCVAFVRLQRAGGWNGRICYVLVTAALLWTHLFSIFVIAAQHLAWLAARLAKPTEDTRETKVSRPGFIPATQWLALNAAALIAFTPWLPTLFIWMRKVAGNFWIPAIGPGMIITTYETYAGSLALLIGLLLLALLGAVRTRQRWKVVLLGGVFVLPVLVPIGVSLMGRPVFVPRYGIMSAAGLYLLAARGWTALPSATWRWVIVLPILALSLWDLHGAARRLDAKPDWRAATSYVLEHDGRGDAIVLNADFNNLVFQHYAGRRSAELDASFLIDSRVEGPGSAALEIPRAASLWVVTQTAVYGNYRVLSNAEIERAGWEVADTRVFDTITVQRFTPTRR
jgi:4-amino-4-deoxy-L-arabinose transferase-like glycosyltransferase